MSTLNIDILNAFKRKGFDDKDAELIASEMAKVNPDQLATKLDIVKIDRELTLVKWMLGFLLAISLTLLFIAIKTSIK